MKNRNLSVVNFRGSATTISLIKWTGLRKGIFITFKKIGLINKFLCPIDFVPKYEISLFEHELNSINILKPELIFYFSNLECASDGFKEIQKIISEDGLHGLKIVEFMRNGNYKERAWYSPNQSDDIFTFLGE